MLRRCQFAMLCGAVGLLRRTPSPLLAIPAPKVDNSALFVRYADIDNGNQGKINSVKENNIGGPNDEWIGTEKVHGANFGIFSLDHGKSIRYAKRNGMIADKEIFFGYHLLIPQFMKQIQVIRELMKERYGDLHTIICNGELFGGKYDHKNLVVPVPEYTVFGAVHKIQAVQKDDFPQYSPNLHFYAFDIKYKAAADAPIVELTFDQAEEIFKQVPDLLYARAVIRGTIDDIAAFPIEQVETAIPLQLGLGNYPLKNNWWEGLVVRHAKRGLPSFQPTSAPTLFKLKTVAFQELATNEKRMDPMTRLRLDAIAKAGLRLPAMEVVFPEQYHKDVLHLIDHVCLNRLNNAVSKIGTHPLVTKKMSKQELASILAEDALKDFLKEAAKEVVNAPMKIRQEMCRYVHFEAQKLVFASWKKLVDEQAEAPGGGQVGGPAAAADAVAA